MWNVQHGSAVYIQTPNGKHIAIDLGAGDAFSLLQHLSPNPPKEGVGLAS